MSHKKIVFRLEQDEDGYPPVAAESVWAEEGDDGHLVIDNIPFFAAEATLGDIVEAQMVHGALTYRRTVAHCGNSLVRIAYRPETDPAEIRAQLEGMGCSSELDTLHRLIAVNIPRTVDLRLVQAFLERGANEDRWGYEEPLLMQ